MPQGHKSSYTDKQKREAEHVEGYEDRGVGRKESGESPRNGGRKAGSSQTAADHSAAAKKGWETRRKQGNA